jgi:hypothetical protein
MFGALLAWLIAVTSAPGSLSSKIVTEPAVGDARR